MMLVLGAAGGARFQETTPFYQTRAVGREGESVATEGAPVTRDTAAGAARGRQRHLGRVRLPEAPPIRARLLGAFAVFASSPLGSGAGLTLSAALRGGKAGGRRPWRVLRPLEAARVSLFLAAVTFAFGNRLNYVLTHLFRAAFLFAFEDLARIALAQHRSLRDFPSEGVFRIGGTAGLYVVSFGHLDFARREVHTELIEALMSLALCVSIADSQKVRSVLPCSKQ